MVDLTKVFIYITKFIISFWIHEKKHSFRNRKYVLASILLTHIVYCFTVAILITMFAINFTVIPFGIGKIMKFFPRMGSIKQPIAFHGFLPTLISILSSTKNPWGIFGFGRRGRPRCVIFLLFGGSNSFLKRAKNINTKSCENEYVLLI